MRRLLATLAVLPVIALAGCGGASTDEGSVPESASLAPADSVGFVTVVTDEGSSQWKNTAALLDLVPDVRDGALSSVESALGEEGVSWKDDIAPALGPELVVVVTKDRQPILLVQPDDAAKLDALLERTDAETVHADMGDGWTALAQTPGGLAGYRASLEAGTLDGVEGFRADMDALPADTLARAWVDASSLTDEARSLAASVGTGATDGFDLGIDSLSAAVSAEDDGVLVALAFRGPKGTGTSSYEPALFARVPGDAVVAFSFGGTQGVLDQIEQRVDVDAISKQLERAVGVSLDGVLGALSGEGVVYVRPAGGSIPEVTVVLAPPNPKEALVTIDGMARNVAQQVDGRVEAAVDDGVDVTVVTANDVSLRYGMLDEDTVIATTSASGIDGFVGSGSKLVETEDFTTAADQVGLSDRTRGFVYVDLDGLVSLVEQVAGPDKVPAGARDAVERLDSFILQTDGDGSRTRATGFLQLTGT